LISSGCFFPGCRENDLSSWEAESAVFPVIFLSKVQYCEGIVTGLFELVTPGAF